MFLALPDAIFIDIVQQWCRACDVVKVDTAFLTKSDRSWFHESILASIVFDRDYGAKGSIKSAVWAELRNLSSFYLNIGLEEVRLIPNGESGSWSWSCVLRTKITLNKVSHLSLTRVGSEYKLSMIPGRVRLDRRRPVMRAREFTLFLEQFPAISSLHLCSIDCYDNSVLENLSTLSQLKQIRITDCSFDNKDLTIIAKRCNELTSFELNVQFKVNKNLISQIIHRNRVSLVHFTTPLLRCDESIMLDLSSCCRLESFYIKLEKCNNETTEHLTNLVESCLCLKNWTIAGEFGIISLSTSGKLSRALKLKKLSFDADITSLWNALSVVPLTEIYLKKCCINDAFLKDAISTFPNLVGISIKNCSSYSHKSLRFIFKKCTSLLNFVLHGFDGTISKKASSQLTTVFDNAHKLQYLCIKNSPMRRYVPWQIHISCPNLKLMVLLDCVKFSNKDFMKFTNLNGFQIFCNWTKPRGFECATYGSDSCDSHYDDEDNSLDSDINYSNNTDIVDSDGNNSSDNQEDNDEEL